ncbi:LutC/YkgG family protein [Helicobacter brantae]|uniref:Lactate utilization protein C n=1 Tax=Helicobacter brantae TaxID=375927 RepID=A0A3D8IXP7_9HELI|nr:lactate utilization protein C [Helicobacter brantae]RDU69746.1 lactate utilization protein C [Helicobacter brantae]
MSKEKILHNIQNALKHNPLQNEKGTYRDIIIPIEKDKIAEYKRAQIANKAELIETSEGEIPQVVNEILQKEGFESILVPKNLSHLPLQIKKIDYDKPMEELKDELFSTDCALLEADYGVSNLGIISLVSSPTQPRLLSLITKCSVILLKKEKILSNMSEVFAEIKKQYPEVLPTNILFIAGPSRTADIELQVVFGVHGPQKVYIILY